jgi:hypothetical protein
MKGKLNPVGCIEEIDRSRWLCCKVRSLVVAPSQVAS